jgi:hypothetical protein
MVLRGIVGPKRENGENCIIRNFIIHALHPILLRRLNEGR